MDSGCIIYLLMMAAAFMGYVLVWGQMSFWAADRDHQSDRRDPIGRRPDPALLRGGFAIDIRR